MSTVRQIRPRSRPLSLSHLVAIGDVVVLGGLIAYGLRSHGLDPLAIPQHAATVAAPFVLGWLIVATLAGLYGSQTIRSPIATMLLVVPAWLFVTLVGSMIRVTELVPGRAPPVFVLVIFSFGLAFLLSWRLFVAALTS